MNRLDEILIEMLVEAPSMSFSEIIRETRDKLGLKQYVAAEHLKIPMARLKNLETGYFRDMPKANEVKELSDLYKVPFDLLTAKAEKHVRKRKAVLKSKAYPDG